MVITVKKTLQLVYNIMLWQAQSGGADRWVQPPSTKGKN